MLQVLHSIGGQLGQFLRRQQALDALRRSEMRLRVLNDLASDWFWEQDGDFRFTQIVGCSAFGTVDTLGMTLWDLPNVVPAGAGWSEHKSQLTARWSFCDFEFVIVHPGAQDIYYSICGEPVYDEMGAFSGYCGTGLDITKRRRAEIALRESEARLRAEIALRESEARLRALAGLTSDKQPAMAAGHSAVQTSQRQIVSSNISALARAI